MADTLDPPEEQHSYGDVPASSQKDTQDEIATSVQPSSPVILDEDPPLHRENGEESTVAIEAPVSSEVSGGDQERFYQVPTRTVSWLYRILFGLAAIVVGVDNVTIKQLILPAQMALISPDNKITAFTLVASVGALAGVIASPLIGAISDRTTWRWGRRRLWMIIGCVSVVIGLVIMGSARTVGLVLLGEIIVQCAADTLLAVYSAVIPDQIPPAQRASASAFVGMSPLVGGVVGIALISRLTNVLNHPDTGYYILAAASVVLVGCFFTVFREEPLPRKLVKPFSLKALLSDFWVDPRQYPDFGFVWLSRCLAYLGYQLLITYLLYYLQDVIHFNRADQGVTIFQICSTVMLLIAAIVGGIIADRTQRLKPFVSWAAVVMCIAMLGIAFIPAWPALLVAGIFLGLGFGLYLAVDQAIAVKVLPRASARGKDLGLINTAIFFPLIIGPLIGGFVLNVFHSYSILFAISAIAFAFAAATILPVKSVR